MPPKPQNLFFTTSFLLIVLGGILYSKPIILAIIDRGFTADRGFDLISGLALGSIATKKKMDQDNVYTPKGMIGRDKSDVIAQQIAQPIIDIAQSVQPISQAINEVQAVQEVLNPVADIAKMVTPNDPTVNAIADVIESPFKALGKIRL
jgi:hypothetical protein